MTIDPERPSGRLAFIMRGVSGAGKTTMGVALARRLNVWPRGVVSSDAYRWIDGNYVFQAGGMDCYRAARREWLTRIQAGVPAIFDARNLLMLEWAPLAVVAVDHGFRVALVTVLAPLDVAVEQNQHGVPPAEIAKHFAALAEGDAELEANAPRLTWLRQLRISGTAIPDPDAEARRILEEVAAP